jgi:hypothetical protein
MSYNFRDLIARLSENEDELRTLLRAYIQPGDKESKLEYFLTAYKKVTNQGDLKSSLSSSGNHSNIAAGLITFFCGPLIYPVYRKIYAVIPVYFIMLIAVSVVCGASIGMLSGTSTILISIIAVVFYSIPSAIVSRVANYFIIKRFCKNLLKLGYGTTPTKQVAESLNIRGGVDYIGTVIASIFTSLLTSLLSSWLVSLLLSRLVSLSA